MSPGNTPAMREARAATAPGTGLRDGLDRILASGMGALIVVGDSSEVLNVCSGGFLLDAAFTPQRLSELAKMDGAIILAAGAERIARTNVHLVPSPNVPTRETGTRHRTAERVARSIPVPVISISERMAVVAVYVGEDKYELESIARVLERANQALSTLQHYRTRLDEVAASLTSLEVEDVVTARDVISVVQRAEMVSRIAAEIDHHIIDLGTDGRLVRLQLEELYGGVEHDQRLALRDYLPDPDVDRVGAADERVGRLDTDELLDLAAVSAAIELSVERLDDPVQPRGYRMLSMIPRLPAPVVTHIVDRFGTLPKILRASVEDLVEVEGVGGTRARAVMDGLKRIADSTIPDSYG